jgi:acid phosphatase family membrane protein YuiD
MLSLTPAEKVVVEFRRASTEEVKALLSNGGFISAIGHPATASALSKILGVNVPTNRVAITLQPGDTLIVFQLAVGRLAPGQELTEQDILSAFSQGKAYFVIARVQ